jgi:hypothetical protein
MIWLLSTPPHQEVRTVYDSSFSLSLLLLLLLLLSSLICISSCLWFLHFLFFLGKQQKRVGLLMMAALFEGASIGPMIDLAIQIDPRYVPIFLKVWLLYSLFSCY